MLVIASGLALAIATSGAIAQAGGGTLSGTVRRRTGDTPIAGAMVIVSGPRSATVTTGEDGSFKFPDLPPGAYKLTVKVGGKQVERDVTVDEGRPATADIRVASTSPAAASPPAAEEIVVLAQRTPQELARKVQQEAPNLVNVQTYDEIRKLPDLTTSEAVRRIPGISMETDEGEGRYINIRGCDADLNSTTFDGVHLLPTNNASPFGGYRALALDSIPIGFIGGIEVTKSNLPSQDAEALCGTINILPKTAPANRKPFIEGEFGSGYEPLRQTPVDNFSLTGGGSHGPLSLVLTASRHEDFRGIDDVEPAYINDSAHPYFAINNIQQRDYELHRIRHGYAGDLSYQPDAVNRWYVRAFEAGYTEYYERQFLNLTPDGNTVQLPNGQLQDTLNAPNAIQKALRHEQETSTERLFMGGGKHTLPNDATFDYHVAYVTGDYFKPYDYNSFFSFNPPAGSNAVINYTLSGAGHTPLYTITGVPGYLDPANYTLNNFSNSRAHNYDHEVSVAANLKFPVQWTGWDKESVQVGGEARIRHKAIGSQPYSYPNAPALSLASASSGDPETYYNGQYQNGIDIKPGYLQSVLGTGIVQPSDQISALQQFLNAHENIYAGYTQYGVTIGRLGILAGVRFEQTIDHANAWQAGFDTNHNPFAFPISSHNSYHNFFPSLQTRYEIAPSLLARATYSSTIARPGFNQSNPALSIDLGSGIASVGNPGLKPATSNSFDVSLERYLPGGGIMSVGAFDKELSNYIVPVQTTEVLPLNGQCAGCFAGLPLKVFTYENVPSSYARGIELNWWQHFSELPGILSGLGAGANYTFVYSQIEIRPGEFSLLPSTSRHTANASLFYDKYGLHMNLALYYVSADLFGIGTDRSSDIFNASRLSMDFGSSYDFTENWAAYFAAKNLLDTPHAFYEGTPDRPIQREFYGQTYLVGLRFHY